ncbi:uncharacterized protein Z519_03607 [Cladophialophora bantiana CBS 173.52]|uniref:Endonuclease/exonuclease/phosphatase domain-containing protein n=1 Tax=Cladophialophora bantiana (strain ATCC 10958 / CBS 173.52 / CDC B-1940 / NIH 8579) TaxID=1442370 RepID=A0A0D2EYJ8_CLAB1|nr:uncharacterized protein Z519_03607 [Cladophialophora bantiana CBS 173.52]KIW95026.1 hypothetical protein Z519_03607 [Cladophialophora bantiana CBS 173.52]
MAPRWPQVNNGPEHINEHATYLREACNQLQAADKGRTNQIPWHIVQSYTESTLALIGKVLQQPSVGEVLHHIQDAAKDIQAIQRDVTAVKSSIGLGTTSLNSAKGSTLLPPPSVLVQPGSHTTKTQSTVTAYRDRLVTVKLKDYSIVQRYRNHPITWTKQQVQNSIRDNTATRAIKLVDAHQLKSGWLKGLGDQAEVIVPTYGVIVHGISTKSINIKDQRATIQQILTDNYTVIPDAKISYVEWLTREGPLKHASSIVVKFTAPEMANAVIYAVSEPDTAGGRIFRGFYMYCGVDYHRPPTLRMHLKSAKKHAQNNISVVRETMGRGSSDTPSWTPKPRVDSANDARVTRRQAATNSAKYNVQKSKNVVLASLFQDRWISEYEVLAIQEPWRNHRTSYHPLKTHFQLAYPNDRNTRVCFYINKRVDASTWNVSFITKDIIALEIIHPVLHHKVSIINVYNELGTSTLDDLR